LDIKIAFLRGELHEEIFLHQLKGFIELRKEHLLCELKKALYVKQNSYFKHGSYRKLTCGSKTKLPKDVIMAKPCIIYKN
jgi:hypothetical protein